LTESCSGANHFFLNLFIECWAVFFRNQLNIWWANSRKIDLVWKGYNWSLEIMIAELIDPPNW